MVGAMGLLNMDVLLVNNGLVMDDVTVVIMFGRILPCGTELLMLKAGRSLPCGDIRKIDLPEFCEVCASIDCGITMILGALWPDMVDMLTTGVSPG